MIYKFYQQKVFPHLLNQIMQVPSMMDSRRRLLLPITGEVLEIGFGTGINLPFYQQVDQLYALEPNPDVFRLAQSRIEQSAFHVKHIAAHAELLPFERGVLENIVSTWTLCSVSNVAQVLQEIYRVLKPGGHFHLVEHVAYDLKQQAGLKRWQDILTPIQKVIADGCHLNRDIEQALLEAGFHLDHLDYFFAEDLPKVGRRMLLARVSKPLN